MPCRQCDNGKWRWGSGPCTYDSKAGCERANSERERIEIGRRVAHALLWRSAISIPAVILGAYVWFRILEAVFPK